MSAEQQVQPIIPKHIPVGNFMLAMMLAVEKDQTTLSSQQITDAKSTEIAVKIEANIYNFWINELDILSNDIANYKKEAKIAGRTPSAEMKYLVSYYSTMQTDAQKNETEQDAVVQANQGQASSDATNLQMKAQLVQGINSILTSLAALLGRITA